MQTKPCSSLLLPNELPAARAQNLAGAASAVLVCEHASRFIPARLHNLGLDAAAARSHVAWDIGALALALELMRALDAALVHSCISRLVYDCNRPPSRADAMPAHSEVFAIPGNAHLTEADRDQRTREVYLPFNNLLSEVIASRAAPCVLITIHSFTPVYNGVRRDLELGILHDSDERAACALLPAARRSGLKCALNEPYSARDGVTHTLREHAIARGLLNVMLEVRNDLIDAPPGVARIAGLLAPMLRALITDTAGEIKAS